MTTLFDEDDGFQAYQGISRNFYAKVRECDHLKHYFNGVSINAIIDQQARFLSRSLDDSDDESTEVDLAEVHAHLAITEDDFSEMVEILTEALEDAEVETKDVIKIITRVASLKDQIVSA